MNENINPNSSHNPDVTPDVTPDAAGAGHNPSVNTPAPAGNAHDETMRIENVPPVPQPAQPSTQPAPQNAGQPVPQRPYQGQPYQNTAGMQQTAQFSSVPAGNSSAHFAGGAPQPQSAHAVAAQPKKQNLVMPLVATAALTAILASVATVGISNLVDTDNNAPTSSSQSATQQHGTTGTVAPIENSTDQNPNWEAVTNAVAKTVVAIEVESAGGGSQGSGVIIDTEGHIITNNHVVEGANNNEVSVTLDDGRIYTAEITGLDPATDLAVIKIKNPPADLASASLANSDDVTVGSSVLAMGNPLGLSQTATTGIVSALDRPVSTAQTSDGTLVVTNAIQIDAAINPGNSGGPLFNSKGEVIGITSSIATMSGSSTSQSGSIGLGFAIPANLAQNISSQLIESGKAEHAFLGVAMSDGSGTVGDETRQGAVVQEVTADSGAAKAGVQVNDVVVSANGKNVTGSESLTGFVRELGAGDTITLGVIRDGKLVEVAAVLGAKTEEATTLPESDQNNGGNSEQNPWGNNPRRGGDSGSDGSGQDGSGNDDSNRGNSDGNSDNGNSDQSSANNTPSWEELQELLEQFQNGR